jgi:hypothetical protein
MARYMYEFCDFVGSKPSINIHRNLNEVLLQSFAIMGRAISAHGYAGQTPGLIQSAANPAAWAACAC